MSVYFGLDESLITVAPALDDVEPTLIVRTRYQTYSEDGADGVIRSSKSSKRLHPVEVESGHAVYETRISNLVTEGGKAEFSTQTVYLAGGVGSVFYATDRKVTFSARWYGENNRYLELRIRVTPGAELVANRGMAAFRDGDTEFNYLGRLKKESWAELHIDNHTHVGLSMAVHPTLVGFTKPAKKIALGAKATATRWNKILDVD